MYKLEAKASRYAQQWHIHQKYDTVLPYYFHLNLVNKIAHKYTNLLGKELHEHVLSAAYLHDSLEDVNEVTYNNLKQEFGTNVADIVYALTNEKGKTRKERANEKYYKGINSTRGAVFVKLCDRIANVLYGTMFGGMVDMYRKENAEFISALDTKGLNVMVSDLEKLFEFKIFDFNEL